MKKYIGAVIMLGMLVVAGAGCANVSAPTTSHNDDAAMMQHDTMPEEKVAPNAGDAMMKDEDDSMVDKDDAMMKKEDGAMMKKDEGAMKESGADAMMEKEAAAGSYELYAPEKLAAAKTGTVVLFFRAKWCPTCQQVDVDIRQKLSQIPAGVTILDVDYDNSRDLQKKYGVTYQHTFVQVDASGTMIKKWSGSPTLADVVKQI